MTLAFGETWHFQTFIQRWMSCKSRAWCKGVVCTAIRPQRQTDSSRTLSVESWEKIKILTTGGTPTLKFTPHFWQIFLSLVINSCNVCKRLFQRPHQRGKSQVILILSLKLNKQVCFGQTKRIVFKTFQAESPAYNENGWLFSHRVIDLYSQSVGSVVFAISIQYKVTWGCLKLDACWWLKWWNQHRINILSRCPIQIKPDGCRQSFWILEGKTSNCNSIRGLVWCFL